MMFLLNTHGTRKNHPSTSVRNMYVYNTTRKIRDDKMMKFVQVVRWTAQARGGGGWGRMMRCDVLFYLKREMKDGENSH